MDDEKQFYTIVLKHDTSSNWMTNNPVLALGEYGVEDDTHRVKRGDGESTWSLLSYETFGLEFIVTYKNLSGNIEDNNELQQALNDKVSLSIFKDGNSSIVTGISILSDVGVIGKITRTAKDLSTGASSVDNVIIQSSDTSINGLWSIDPTGARILDLSTVVKITDFKTEHQYNKDEFCIFNNRIYRAKTTFITKSIFDVNDWYLMTSLYATDISYNPSNNELASETVQGAIDEVVQLLAQKVAKTSQSNKVYGTNEYGDQQFIDKDALRKVDTVNNVQPDINKNVQIDANDINYDDEVSAELKQTIKQVLDSKVNKTIAGAGNKIVQDASISLNEENGDITLTTNNISLEDGSQETKQTTVNVVSGTELSNSEKTINDRIDQEVNTLNQTIDSTKSAIESELQTDLNTKIDKDISDTLVSDITVLQAQDNDVVEPTIQVTSKNTDTKTDVVKNIHFKSSGDIQTKVENDHIVIDSSVIDTNIQNNTKHLTEVDTRLDNNDKEIASLQEHDLNHESELATHTSQIANHETRIVGSETHIDEIDDDITNIKNVNASQESHLTSIDQTLSTHTQQIQDNADTLVETNKNVSKNAQDITNLENKAVVYNKERNIDVENNIALKKNMMLTGATPTQYYNLASMKTYNLGLENELTQTEFGTNKVHMNLNSSDRPTVELPSSEKHEISYKDELDTAKSEISQELTDLTDTINNTVNTKLQELDSQKLDKSFTDKLVNNISYTGPQSSELFKLNKQDINPNDNSTSNSTFTIKSSDNTLVAKPIMDSENLVGIDLATNLDIDVHYFVTSEILNTTIPSDNTIQISSLTDTTSDNVEVKDIVSDTEGTWARVQEVDNEAGTLKCVTFAKHAQAVWGTVKGNIQDQQDLQEEFETKVNTTDVLNTVESVRFALSGNTFRIKQKSYIPLNGNTPQFGNYNLALSFPSFMSPKSSNLTTDSTWGDISFDVNTDLLSFDPKETGLTNYVGPAVRQVKELVDNANTEIDQLQTDLTTKINKATFAENPILTSPLSVEVLESNDTAYLNTKQYNSTTDSLKDTRLIELAVQSGLLLQSRGTNGLGIQIDSANISQYIDVPFISELYLNPLNNQYIDSDQPLSDTMKQLKNTSFIIDMSLYNGQESMEIPGGALVSCYDNGNNTMYLAMNLVPKFTIPSRNDLLQLGTSLGFTKALDYFNWAIEKGIFVRIGIPNETGISGNRLPILLDKSITDETVTGDTGYMMLGTEMKESPIPVTPELSFDKQSIVTDSNDTQYYEVKDVRYQATVVSTMVGNNPITGQLVLDSMVSGTIPINFYLSNEEGVNTSGEAVQGRVMTINNNKCFVLSGDPTQYTVNIHFDNDNYDTDQFQLELYETGTEIETAKNPMAVVSLSSSTDYTTTITTTMKLINNDEAYQFVVYFRRLDTQELVPNNNNYVPVSSVGDGVNTINISIQGGVA